MTHFDRFSNKWSGLSTGVVLSITPILLTLNRRRLMAVIGVSEYSSVSMSEIWVLIVKYLITAHRSEGRYLVIALYIYSAINYADFNAVHSKGTYSHADFCLIGVRIGARIGRF